MEKMIRWSMALILTICMGCTVKTPEFQLTGEKTALEKQIIGSYTPVSGSKLEYISRYYSNSYQLNPSKNGSSKQQDQIFSAIQNQAFNKDDINRFKTKGCVGENNEGLLEFRSCSEAQNAEQQRLMSDIVAEENRDREVIMMQVIESNPELIPEDMPKIKKLFGDRNRDHAKTGEWIQNDDGDWLQKP